MPIALTNQPPVPPRPRHHPPVAAGGPTASQPPPSTSKNATINYEVDKTIQHPARRSARSAAVGGGGLNQREKDKSGALKPSRSTTKIAKRVENLVGDAVGL